MSNLDPELSLYSGYIPETNSNNSTKTTPNQYAVRPITSKIAMEANAVKNGENTSFVFQGHRLGNVVLVGIVNELNQGKKVISFRLDDSTGVAIPIIKTISEGSVTSIENNKYVRVFGDLSIDKNDSNCIFAQRIEIIENYNIITEHLLEIMKSYLYYENEGKN